MTFHLCPLTSPENLRDDDLGVGLAPQTRDDEDAERDEVDEEGGPRGEAEGHAERAHQHQVDRAGTQDGANHHHDLGDGEIDRL